MKKIEGNKLVALLISAGMATTMLAACTINTDELGQGISDLGNAFVTSQTEIPTQPETTASEETETTAETTEETAAPTPSATPTATPSPTPLPRRVDFSDYTDDIITDDFTVTLEDFSESAYTDSDDMLLARFDGKRLVVTDAANENVRNAINILVDGFYREAEGAYNRVISKAEAAQKLTGVVEHEYTVSVIFSYTTNGRVLSILMRYDVIGVEEDESTVIDFASFDMLSGQYVTLSSVTTDPAGLEKALRSALAEKLKAEANIPTPAVTTTNAGTDETVETTTETETTETVVNVKTPSASEFEKIYVGAGSDIGEGGNGACITVYGVVNNEVYSSEIDITLYQAFLNRYGTSVLIV